MQNPFKINDDSIPQLRDELMDFTDQVSNFASNGAMIMAAGGFIVLSIILPFSLINILAGICLLNIVFDVFFALKLFGQKGKRYTDIYCVGFLMCIIPFMWFGLGGFKGAGGIWMLFAAIYCMFAVGGKIRTLMQRILSFEVIISMAVNIIHPEFVKPLEGFDLYLVSIFSLLGVGMYLQTISYLQGRAFVADKEHMRELQDDLAAHYEEAIAMNDELMNTTDKLEMANKTQKSFTASMNHEMRAPLNGIEGCLQILMMDDGISEESKETVKNALTASKTINETINDLLDFAKLEEGKFEVVKRQFDLRDTLDNISTIFKPQAHAKNLKFIIQIPRDSRVSLVADSKRIQQVMTNLISNAVKYTKTGTVELIVTTERGHLKFDVKDSGQGMSEESLKVLFDPFTRFNLDENVNIQGTGLGMNIVSNLIKAMKGSITVESKLNVGTTFHVDIPIMFYDSDITFSTPREKETSLVENVDLSRFKVLCVDDTEINRTVFKGLLKRTGAYVLDADNGMKAVKMCQEQDFDIIFLDHQMPEMDGLETMDAIRKISSKFMETPIVMFTGNANEEYQELYKRRGANGYLLKPVMFEDLVACFNL